MNMHNHPAIPYICSVRERFQENDDTFTVELEPVNGNSHSPFAAGQFNMLYVYGLGEIPISISGDPAAPDRLLHTTRAVGNVTRAMARLRPGDMLGVRGPFGTAWPLDDAKGRDVLLIAGGIGLAPLRPALYQMIEHRNDYGKIVLLYGARTQEDILFRSELERWRARFDLDIYVTVDRATGEWHGSVGLVTALIPRAPFDPQNSVALVCGPEVMMRYTIQALAKRGVPVTQTYLSTERNMKCGCGLCGHCQFGPLFVCKDGPVFRLDHIQSFFGKWEV
ncbi:MAG: FAD/NAD(P)-binding protein [Anaerolineales bacterium]|nr:FAD/NAD(P)-binding protein [Anaerolineales bacterium]